MSRAFKKLFGLGSWYRGPELALVIQQRSIESFNHARSGSPQWKPDFRGASLRGMDLSYANIKAANFVGADLDGVIIDNLEMTDERARVALARRGAIVE
jgi:uncharacterized protein YjbI with pentapeptide repeats